jgi:uncharacterized protein YggE
MARTALPKSKLPRKPGARVTRRDFMTVNTADDAVALVKALATCGCDILLVESSCLSEADMRALAVKQAAKDAYDKAQAALAWSSVCLGTLLSCRVRDRQPLTGEGLSVKFTDGDQDYQPLTAALARDRHVEVTVEVVYELLPAAEPESRPQPDQPLLPGTSE